MTVAPAWVFLHEDGEGVNARVARCCVEALRAGPMGRHERGDFYREFISCDWDPPLTTGKGIETLSTSCGIFLRGVLHWSGRYTTRPGAIGQPLVGGWLEGLHIGDKAWLDPHEGDPRPGDVFLRMYSKQSKGYEAHVGIFVEHLGGRRWRTAEGGGGVDGTRCRHEEREPWSQDSSGRVLVGWWRPERMEGFGSTADTEPAPPPESEP